MSGKLYVAITAGIVAIGVPLIYSIWFRAGPSHINSFKSQDGQYEIVFDSETEGRFRSHMKNTAQNDESVSIEFEKPSTYKIKTKSHGELDFTTDTRGPLFFICQACISATPPMDGLWIAK